MPKKLTVHRDGTAIYDIILDTSFNHLADEVKKFGLNGRRICIVTDSTVAELYLDQVRKILAPCCRELIDFTFPAGEPSKNLNTVQDLYETLILNHFDRKDWLVALGGGVVGDLCGYAAATYLRGVSFIQIPTTLLSQVDSSIGGKTGVDFSCYKNMVGAFHMPKLVYTNVRTLLTLSQEQYSSGMGEVIKHGLILDEAYYKWILAHKEEIRDRDLDICLTMILQSNEIKRQVVEEDPTEQGQRALLNFGHTLGHALEKQLNFRYLHGHCVGLGCLAAMKICEQRGFIAPSETKEFKDLMEFLQMPTEVSGPSQNDVLADTKSDKKMDGNTIRFILLQKIGQAYIDLQVTAEEMRTGLSNILKQE